MDCVFLAIAYDVLFEESDDFGILLFETLFPQFRTHSHVFAPHLFVCQPVYVFFPFLILYTLTATVIINNISISSSNNRRRLCRYGYLFITDSQ